jgi:hypothetical protein
VAGAVDMQAFEALGEFLKLDGWYPRKLDGKTVYQVGFNGENGQLTCYAQVLEDLSQFLFYVVAPTKVSEELRLAVAELITRANYGLRIGNFEMDFSDGEVRYKSSLDFEGTALSSDLIRNAIYPAVQTMDRYLPAIMAVIYGEKSPEEAITEIEGK